MKGAHEDLVAHEEVPRSSNRSFGLVFAAVFGLVAGYRVWNGLHWWAPAGVAVIFALFAWLRPDALAPLNRLWAQVGLLLHRVVNPIVMGVMFFGAVLPIGLLMRLFGKDPLRLKLESKAMTYWQPREPAAADHFKDQF